MALTSLTGAVGAVGQRWKAATLNLIIQAIQELQAGAGPTPITEQSFSSMVITDTANHDSSLTNVPTGVPVVCYINLTIRQGTTWTVARVLDGATQIGNDVVQQIPTGATAFIGSIVVPVIGVFTNAPTLRIFNANATSTTIDAFKLRGLRLGQ